jgi:hypothetical protein
MAVTISILTVDLLDRIVKHLDILSALLLSCTNRRLRRDVWPLWVRHAHSAPDPPCHLAEAFTSVASAALSRSALHTSSPHFTKSSAIPCPLPLRHAAAALDIAQLVAVLPACELEDSSVSADRSDGKRPPPAKISALQTAVLCRSARAVGALLGEGHVSTPLRLDLNVRRLPNALLGTYTVPTVFGKCHQQCSVYATREVTVRTTDHPDAVVSLVHASAMMVSRTCVNTSSVLEMAVLMHDAATCELLCSRQGFGVPSYALSELLCPTLSVCAASMVCLGADCDESETAADMDVSARDSENCAVSIDKRKRRVLSFCEHLEACLYISGLYRITLALARSSKLRDEVSMGARHMAADYGNAELLSIGCDVREIPTSTRAALARRQEWRILYEAAKTAAAIDIDLTCVRFHHCISSDLPVSIDAVNSRLATDEELSTMILPYCRRAQARRIATIRALVIN